MFRITSVLLLTVAVSGCIGTRPARPTVISSQTSAAEAMDQTLRVLARHGFTADRVDDRAGVIQTRWQETTFMYGAERVPADPLHRAQTHSDDRPAGGRLRGRRASRGRGLRESRRIGRGTQCGR
jgi:hypothetical protein